jgi:hypothetical protein
VYWPVSLFFESTGRGWQVGGVDQSHRERPRGRRWQQGTHQLFIDVAKSLHAQLLPKLMQHPGHGQRVSIRQMGEATPSPLLGQHLDQQVKGVDGGEHSQQMHAPELRGTQPTRASCVPGLGETLVDPVVRNMG